MKDYIKVLLSDLKKQIKTFKNQTEELEVKIEIYELISNKLNKALNQSDNTTNKIKEFINELEHNIQVDEYNNLHISGVTCNYVIEKLKDIIK